MSNKGSINLSNGRLNGSYNSIARIDSSLHAGIKCKEEEPNDSNNDIEDIPDERKAPIVMKTSIETYINNRQSLMINSLKKNELLNTECQNSSKCIDPKKNISIYK